ncbi:T3SS effector HopA1 family protein (plasmid) [Streptomyces sp. HU2014]|uniref:T3SS effector HopA1 family protein n=1 Tax=Streptomyces sp. HU2014 TaxID=2939414 RepID=UPI00200C22B9|nr:T3SS effector HopA1 family protein [Streptomyces sp. HU2014]UQI49736.1 T3SS effector HopA1 family protein [Streptomyces sp. HU2014]
MSKCNPLHRLLAAARKDDRGDVTLDGRQAPRLSTEPEGIRHILLASWIYETFHALGSATSVLSEDDRFCEALARLHPVRGIPEPGWTIEPDLAGEAPAGGCVVARDGLRVAVPLSAITSDGVLQPSVRKRFSPGYLGFLSPAGLPTRDADRIYIHATAQEAPVILGRLLPVLCASHRPWGCKALSTPGAYPRADSLVVYVDQASTMSVLRQVRVAARPLPAGRSVSVFAEQAAPGVAWAQVPTDVHESAGLLRSRALATALLAWDGSAGGGNEELMCLAHTGLRRLGVDPDHVHLRLTADVPEEGHRGED